MDNLRMYVYLRHGGRVFRAEDVAGLSTYPIPVRDATAYGCVQVTVRDIRPASLTQVVDFCYVRRTVFAWAQLVPPRVRRVTIEHARVELPADIAAALVCTDALAIRECRLRAFPFRDLPAHMRTLDVSRNEISGRIDLSHTT